jgi:hypothetical protein
MTASNSMGVVFDRIYRIKKIYEEEDSGSGKLIKLILLILSKYPAWNAS